MLVLLGRLVKNGMFIFSWLMWWLVWVGWLLKCRLLLCIWMFVSVKCVGGEGGVFGLVV